MKTGYIILFIVLLLCSCGADNRKESKTQTELEMQEPPYTPPAATPVRVDSVPKNEPPKASQPSTSANNTPAPPSAKEIVISKEYQEGYEKGYDDGEDDAVMENGWGGQYDDQCRYKGKKRKDYQQGYDEGYEAGYYDNKDGDE